jgi:hypothetical protein
MTLLFFLKRYNTSSAYIEEHFCTFWINIYPVVLFILAIVLSVLRFMASDHAFGILELFFDFLCQDIYMHSNQSYHKCSSRVLQKYSFFLFSFFCFLLRIWNSRYTSWTLLPWYLSTSELWPDKMGDHSWRYNLLVF